MGTAKSKIEKQKLRSFLRKADHKPGVKEALIRHKIIDAPELSDEQLNMQRALKYYLRITAYRDCLEVVNTETPEVNMEIMEMSFGYYDSKSVPCWAFDGCVITYKRLSQVW